MLLYVIIGIVVLLLLWLIVSYNGFIKLSANCEEGFATMDVYLKKRYDLIPNLVETVKGYAAHESKTLEAVVAARSAVASSSTTEEKLQNENILTGTLRSLFAVAEAYPELKANENFKELMNQLNHVEEDIANSRKYYNAVVKIFNFSAKPMFEVQNLAERENVKVSF